MSRISQAHTKHYIPLNLTNVDVLRVIFVTVNIELESYNVAIFISNRTDTDSNNLVPNAINVNISRSKLQN